LISFQSLPLIARPWATSAARPQLDVRVASPAIEHQAFPIQEMLPLVDGPVAFFRWSLGMETLLSDQSDPAVPAWPTRPPFLLPLFGVI
jgi:hypothetical protein